MSTSPIIVSGEFAGRYTVERELGRGATSVVYLARDLDYGRMVAIKVLRDELTTGLAADRFLREIRVTAQLHHPNILPVLHSGEDVGRLFFVLPFMDGGTLRDRLDREKQLPVAEVVAYGVTVANALASAHERNVLHRDVKPENILFTGGQACLADFGIARAITRSADDSTTTQGFVRGTPAYMSPEQASGEQEYDGRSDLYSLACVLYEALAGIQPFVGPTPQAVIAQRLVHPARPLRVYRPSVSGELEAVLARALHVAPADRYQTAREFADALQGIPVPTRELAAVEHSSRSVRKLIIGAGVAIAVGVAAYAVWSSDLVQTRAIAGALDTTRIAVLPFEGATLGAGEPNAADLLRDGLQRWRGVTAVEDFSVTAALRESSTRGRRSDPRRVAVRVRAGRYVRGNIAGSGTRQSVELVLYESRRGASIYKVSMPIPQDSVRVPSFFDALADSLLLRGRVDSASVPVILSQRSAPAVQAMIQGRALLRAWDLARAESLFTLSTEFDPQLTPAYLWLAQSKVWRAKAINDLEPPRIAAERAARDTAHLPRSERLTAIALDHLTHGRYPAACEIYETMIRADSMTFVGWYGLAQCTDFDRLVERAPSAPTGWRFRASKYRTLLAYRRALELLPSVRTASTTRAFAQIRERLSTSPRYLRPGISDDSIPKRFYARAEVRRDTIAFDPIPLTEPLPAGYRTNWPAIYAATLRMREAFSQLASEWIAAEPRAVDAREAFAVSLEMLGDPGAPAAFDSALQLSVDPHERLRLGVGSVIAGLKATLAAGDPMLDRLRQRADSILATSAATDVVDAELLARIAVILGRCGDAVRLTRVAAVPIPGAIRVPQFVIADAQALVVSTALGCTAVPGRGLEEMMSEIARLGGSDEEVRAAQNVVLSAAAQASVSLSIPVLDRFIRPRDYALLARRAWGQGDRRLAASYLDSVDVARSAAQAGDVTPDATLPEARLRLALGDTAGARRVLDLALNGIRHYAPMSDYEAAGNLLLLGSLIRAMVLRGDLGPGGDPTAIRWANAAASLWSSADAELRTQLRSRPR